jgi:short subunit dehydrogenase-like uncharacterized protein
MSDWMIYGAYGYTGELIAREAKFRGLKPVLAGRSRAKLEPLARELGFEMAVFELSDAASVVSHLKALPGLRAVLLCAGPFVDTSAVMVQACLQARLHYLDITGEIQVFEQTMRQHAQAQAAGVVLCSGVGFDVIPTDCVAAALKEALPDAVELSLGIDTPQNLSPGTLKSYVDGMGNGGCVRRNGELTTVPLASIVRTIDFGQGKKLAMAVPWGDVSTAYHSTGIPNVAVFFPTSRLEVLGAKIVNHLGPFMRSRAWRSLVDKGIRVAVNGPSAQARAASPSYIWGEAVNAKGERRTAWLKTGNGYDLTVTGALAIVTHLLDPAHGAAGGAYTPSRLLGAGLVSRLPHGGQIRIE